MQAPKPQAECVSPSPQRIPRRLSSPASHAAFNPPGRDQRGACSEPATFADQPVTGGPVTIQTSPPAPMPTISSAPAQHRHHGHL